MVRRRLSILLRDGIHHPYIDNKVAQTKTAPAGGLELFKIKPGIQRREGGGLDTERIRTLKNMGDGAVNRALKVRNVK